MASSSVHRAGDGWFSAGLASSFPNITDSSEKYFKLAWPQPCTPSSSSDANTKVPGCKVFHPKPAGTSPGATATVEEVDMDTAVGEDAWLMREQVLVFQYKGTFHAVDHACPHRAYSLSWGQPFDIEDAGRVVGRGIRCRGHSYAFELSTGIGDRGNYRLGVWEVELRPCGEESVVEKGAEGSLQIERAKAMEVWVKRRPERH